MKTSILIIFLLLSSAVNLRAESEVPLENTMKFMRIVKDGKFVGGSEYQPLKVYGYLHNPTRLVNLHQVNKEVLAEPLDPETDSETEQQPEVQDNKNKTN